jgi:hypothetical protein
MLTHRHLALLSALAVSAFAQQQIITVRTGMVRYVEGVVVLNGELLQPPPIETPTIRLPAIGRDGTLRTRLGRAEVYMGPDSFLRLAENASVKMLANRVDDARLELQNGSLLVDIDKSKTTGLIQILVGGTTVNIRKDGLYRVDANPPALSVFDGDAEVIANDRGTLVTAGRRLALKEGEQPRAFSVIPTDAFIRWSARRATYLKLAGMIPSTRPNGITTTDSVGWLANSYHGMKVYMKVDEFSLSARGGAFGGGGGGRGRGPRL